MFGIRAYRNHYGERDRKETNFKTKSVMSRKNVGHNKNVMIHKQNVVVRTLLLKQYYESE